MRPSQQKNTMKTSVRGVTKEELRKLAETDPSVQVMEVDHTNVFDPWSPGRLRASIDRVADLTRTVGKEATEQAVKEDNELQQFATLHPVMYTKLLDPSFVSNDQMMGAFYFMLKTRSELNRGILTESSAHKRVVDMALATAPKTPVGDVQRQPEAASIEELD